MRHKPVAPVKPGQANTGSGAAASLHRAKATPYFALPPLGAAH